MNIYCLFILYLLCTFAFGQKQVKKTVEQGVLVGFEYERYSKFLGIPFIQPPVGKLRFENPVKLDKWTGELYATKYAAGCPQNCILPPLTCPDKLSEDCVTLNVWVPNGIKNDSVPVIVFFPGGHFEQGGPGVDLYNGQYFVERTGAILVTVGYRLGALGWLTHLKSGVKGNLGLRDAIEGLKWVNRNIAQFGGDPKRITISGQSAGAVITSAMLISPSVWDFFNNAIVQSNPFTIPMEDSVDENQWGIRFMESIECEDITCLRTKSTFQILTAQEAANKYTNLSTPITRFMSLTVTVDGDLVPANAYNAFLAGNVKDCPIMIGSVWEEAHLFIYMAIHKELNSAEYIAGIGAIFWRRAAAASILIQYPPVPTVGDKRPQLGILGTDYVFRCILRNTVASLSKKNSQLYLYEYNHTMSFDGWGPNYQFCIGHVCHGAELPFEFGFLGPNTPTPQELEMSHTMQAQIGNFAATGNPNKGPNPTKLQWNPYSPDKPENMEWGTPSRISYDARKEKCDFLDQHTGTPPYTDGAINRSRLHTHDF